MLSPVDSVLFLGDEKIHYEIKTPASMKHEDSVQIQIEPETEECTICTEDVSPTNMFRVHECGCQFCKQCMENYVKLLITEGDVYSILCPQTGCKAELSPDEIESLCDSSTHHQYVLLKQQMDVEMNPSLSVCPVLGCDTVCQVCSEPGQEDSPQKVNCPKCSHTFCSLCKGNWHPNQNCKEFVQKGKSKLGLSFLYPHEASIKRCPVCKVPIERNEGCAQMMCKRCKHVFCWYCLTSLDDDFLLRHYDKGPCKNKLGHSRASVLWHRAQVIGILTGIGLLLLVISPFLLLLAPLLLCGMCKCCKNCQDCDMDEEEPSEIASTYPV